MAAPRFNVPKEWQDWANLLVGIWLCASPWVLQLDDPQAIRTLLVVGFLVIAAEVFTFFPLRAFDEWINIALGGWLVVAPWLSGMTSAAGSANCVASGLLIAALGAYELWDDRRETKRPA